MASAGFGAGLLVRRFSTTATCNKLVQPPMQLFGLAGSYATALYSAASKQKALDAVEKDLTSVQQIFKQDVKARDFFTDPTEKRAKKKAVFEAMAKKNNYSQVTKNLMDTLTENGRLGKLDEVINSYSQLMKATRGEVSAIVTVAKSLDAADEKELQAALNGFLKKGQKLFITTVVDPSLIGGMTVTIGDKFIDMSLKSKMNKYTEILMNA